jgi:hypothetical protein
MTIVAGRGSACWAQGSSGARYGLHHIGTTVVGIALLVGLVRTMAGSRNTAVGLHVEASKPGTVGQR